MYNYNSEVFEKLWIYDLNSQDVMIIAVSRTG